MSECTACAASNMAIGDAADSIRMDRADIMLAGGTGADHRGWHRGFRRDARALAPER
jgi:3-oxoacyl-(acyl-carrier-protein) synthase